MKNLLKKTGALILMFCAGTFAIAQPLSYKDLLQGIQNIQEQFVPDKRVAILNIEIKDTLQPTMVVSGKTNLTDAKNSIIQYLNTNIASFVDSIRLLPDASLGEKTWALATLSVANLRVQPSDASELASQALMGTPLKILDQKNKWYCVQTPDYYIGWMDGSEMQLLTQNELNRWKNSSRYLYNCISGTVYIAPRKKSEIVSDLVIGDLFEVETKIKGYLKIRIPDGRTGYVLESECISFDEWKNSTPDAKSVLSFAKQMMGFPYLWGGTSSKAIDCSGFTKLAFFKKGLILTRDASQQALYGEPVDFNNINNLKAGDLLFFGRSVQRISHVAIYLDKGDFIHSSGRVHISSIIPGDPKYISTRNCVSARRILSSLNTEGIVCVKDHDWYSAQH